MLRRGGLLDGRLIVESRSGAKPPPLPSIRVRAPFVDGNSFGDALTGTVQPDGAFALRGLMKGSHQLVLDGLRPPWVAEERALPGNRHHGPAVRRHGVGAVPRRARSRSRTPAARSRASCRTRATARREHRRPGRSRARRSSGCAPAAGCASPIPTARAGSRSRGCRPANTWPSRPWPSTKAISGAAIACPHGSDWQRRSRSTSDDGRATVTLQIVAPPAADGRGCALMTWLTVAGGIFLVWLVLVFLFTPGINYHLSRRTSVRDARLPVHGSVDLPGAAVPRQPRDDSHRRAGLLPGDPRGHPRGEALHQHGVLHLSARPDWP